MSSSRRRTKRPWWRRRRNRPPVVLAGLGTVLAAALLVEAATLVLAVRDLTGGVRELEAGQAALGSSPEGWNQARIDAAAPHARAAADRVRAGARRLETDPLLLVASALPGSGPAVRASLDLAAGARAGSDAFFQVLDVARVFAGAKDTAASPAERYLAVAQGARAPFARAHAALGPAVENLRGDQAKNLPGPLRAQVDRAVASLGPVDRQAALGEASGAYLPQALGAGGQKTYLLLLENPGELRAGGGFSGNVGTISFRDGTPVAVDIHPNSYYWPLIKDRYAIPYPLGTYLGFHDNNFDIGDVAWEPDFATNAQLAERMFRSATGRTVDGTIGIDPYAVGAFLEVTGPVEIAGYGTFTSADFFQQLQFIVNVRSGQAGEKDALGRVAPVILSRLLAAPISSWPKAADIFGQAVRGRHIQLYFHDETLAAAARAGAADGRLLNSGRDDYLLVADANVGGTKGDLYVKKQAQLKTEVHPSGLVRHELQLMYDMPLPVDDADRALNPEQGAYVDYIRLYLPGNASLAYLDVTLDGRPGGGSLDRVTVEHGSVVVGIGIRVPRGHRVEVTAYYSAAVPAGFEYRMLWQKEPGTAGLPAGVEISTPGGRRRLTLNLSTDRRVEATW